MIALVILCIQCVLLYFVVTAQSCSDSTSYVLTVQFSFVSSVDALIPQPEQTRIPILVAVAHSSDFVLFRNGQRLNDTTAEVASSGTAFTLEDALERAKDADLVSSYALAGQGAGKDEISPDGEVKLQLEVQSNAPLVSIMSQLSPSPSWYVGIDSYDLCRQLESDSSTFSWITASGDVVLGNFNAGLDKGSSFQSNPDPYDEGIPVSTVGILQGKQFAVMSLEKGTLNSSSRWWHILLGVLAAVAVLILAIFIYFRVRRRSRRFRQSILLPEKERVDW